MPRVLRIINRLNIGGPTYNVSLLTKFMEPEFETLLVSGAIDDTEESSEFILNQYNLKALHVNEMKREINFKTDYAAYKKIQKIIADFKPDIVHTHMAKPGTVGRLAALNAGVPVILHTFHGHYFHSYFSPAKTKVFLNIERYLARKTTGIVVLSDAQKHELCSIYKVADNAKTFVIPLGFDLKRFNENKTEKRISFRTKYHVADDEIAIGIIGRLVPIKNHTLFIKGIKAVLNKTQQKIRAFIIGDGEDRLFLENICKTLEVPFSVDNYDDRNAKITFTSWIKDIDVALAGLDIVALTSLNEGTPVSLIEAQAASKCIVTTRVGGIENIVLPNETALLCESNNEAEFSNQLLRLVDNEDLRNQLSLKSWEHVCNRFHYTRLVNDMSNLYHKLLEKK